MPTHKCFECSKTFTRASLLREHVRVHTGEKPHVCQVCHRTFARPSDLWQHKKTHGDRNHVCSATDLDGMACGAAFHRERDLVRHRTTCKALHTARPDRVEDTCSSSTEFALAPITTAVALNDPSQSRLLSHDAHINPQKCLWKITSALWLALIEAWTTLRPAETPKSPEIDVLAMNLISVISRPSLSDQTILWSSAILLVQSRLCDGLPERHHHLDYIGSVKAPWRSPRLILEEADNEDIRAVIYTLLRVARFVAAQAKLYLLALDQGDIVVREQCRVYLRLGSIAYLVLLTLLINRCNPPMFRDCNLLGMRWWWGPEILVTLFYSVERIHELSRNFWPRHKVSGLASELSRTNTSFETQIASLEKSQLDVADLMCSRSTMYESDGPSKPWLIVGGAPGVVISGHTMVAEMQRKTSDFFERYSEAFKRDPRTTAERYPQTGSITYVWKP